MSGYGTAKDKSGDTYVGGFMAGQRQGTGTLTKSSGKVFSGNWTGGKLD